MTSRFDYEIESVLTTSSFDRFQMSVVTASDNNGKLQKGIAIFPLPKTMKYFDESTYIETSGLMGKPLVISDIQARQLCNFIYQVLAGNLPQEITVFSTGPEISIKLKKYIANWHGGGGYKGRMGYSEYSLFGLLPRVTISRKSLVEFQTALKVLFEKHESD